MIRESLEALQRKYGKNDLKSALRTAGTEFVYCQSEESLRRAFPADGTGLVVITDDNIMLDYLKKLSFYDQERIYVVKQESIDTVNGILTHSKPTVVMGFGGGRVLDVSKMVAFRAGVPLILAPTAPTHDGLLSRNCALFENGKKSSYTTSYATKIIIPEYLWATAGELPKAGRLDVLSDIVALQDVSLAMAEENLVPNARYLSLACNAISRLLHEEDEDDLASALFFSGLAMHESSRYCSGSEHELEKLLMPILNNRYFHGQLVGTSTLLSALVYKQEAPKMPKLFFDPAILYDELIQLFEQKGLLEYALRPLRESDTDIVAKTLRKASSVRPERYTLWNKVDSTKVEWGGVVDTVLKLSS
ncbi:MAG: iron-containing alcohol dehydrogenase [Candidatus Aenigmarchaeota archaeon]|nr:iron-containing alcohol dehydrogenase [Candidatus Aenigmarchaeota archaeon]